MEVCDILLIAWWLLAATTIIPILIVKRRLRIRGHTAAIASHLRGQPEGRFRFSTVGGALPRPVLWATALSCALLGLGLLTFLWINNWTRLLYLNFQFLMILFGITCLWVGLSPNIQLPLPSWLPVKARRAGMTICGLVAFAVGLYSVIGDVFLPRIIVEGRVDSKNDFTRYNRGSEYLVFINGARYKALRDVYLPIHTGDRIHAELGAISQMMLHASMK